MTLKERGEDDTLFKTLRHVEALVNRLDDTLAKAEAEKLGHTLGDLKIDALIDTMADMLLEVKTLFETLGGVEARKHLYTLANTVDKTEAGKLFYTQGIV